MRHEAEPWAGLAELDPTSAVPLYHQLREVLRRAVAELDPHTLVPSEKALMDRTGVGRATARRAIADLVHEGALYTRQGRGTFVAPARVVTALTKPAGFTETMRSLGRTPTTDVLGLERISASAAAGEALSLPRGAEVWIIERLRRIDGEPCMLESAHLPVALAPELDSLDLSGSLYDLLAETYGVAPAAGTEVLMAVNADRELAGLLDVPLAGALLTTARTTVTEAGTPLEYTLRHARGDLCSFRVSLDSGSALGDHSLARGLIEIR